MCADYSCRVDGLNFPSTLLGGKPVHWENNLVLSHKPPAAVMLEGPWSRALSVFPSQPVLTSSYVLQLQWKNNPGPCAAEHGYVYKQPPESSSHILPWKGVVVMTGYTCGLSTPGYEMLGTGHFRGRQPSSM